MYRNKDGLESRIYRAQKFSQSKSNLYQLILKDKKMLKIQLTDEDLCKISKNQYKCFINEKIKIYRRIVLTEMQASKSKSRDLNMNSNETAKYLLNNKFSLELAQLCFSLRSRTYCSKDNYRNKYKNDDIFCEACKLFICTQEHVIRCPKLRSLIRGNDQDEINCSQTPNIHFYLK